MSDVIDLCDSDNELAAQLAEPTVGQSAGADTSAGTGRPSLQRDLASSGLRAKRVAGKSCVQTQVLAVSRPAVAPRPSAGAPTVLGPTSDTAVPRSAQAGHPSVPLQPVGHSPRQTHPQPGGAAAGRPSGVLDTVEEDGDDLAEPRPAKRIKREHDAASNKRASAAGPGKPAHAGPGKTTDREAGQAKAKPAAQGVGPCPSTDSQAIGLNGGTSPSPAGSHHRLSRSGQGPKHGAPHRPEQANRAGGDPAAGRGGGVIPTGSGLLTCSEATHGGSAGLSGAASLHRNGPALSAQQRPKRLAALEAERRTAQMQKNDMALRSIFKGTAQDRAARGASGGSVSHHHQGSQDSGGDEDADQALGGDDGTASGELGEPVALPFFNIEDAVKERRVWQRDHPNEQPPVDSAMHLLGKRRVLLSSVLGPDLKAKWDTHSQHRLEELDSNPALGDAPWVTCLEQQHENMTEAEQKRLCNNVQKRIVRAYCKEHNKDKAYQPSLQELIKHPPELLPCTAKVEGRVVDESCASWELPALRGSVGLGLKPDCSLKHAEYIGPYGGEMFTYRAYEALHQDGFPVPCSGQPPIDHLRWCWHGEGQHLGEQQQGPCACYGPPGELRWRSQVEWKREVDRYSADCPKPLSWAKGDCKHAGAEAGDGTNVYVTGFRIGSLAALSNDPSRVIDPLPFSSDPERSRQENFACGGPNVAVVPMTVFGFWPIMVMIAHNLNGCREPLLGPKDLLYDYGPGYWSIHKDNQHAMQVVQAERLAKEQAQRQMAELELAVGTVRQEANAARREALKAAAREHSAVERAGVAKAKAQEAVEHQLQAELQAKEKALQERDEERQAKEAALRHLQEERQAKEAAERQLQEERQAKEEAMRLVEEERQAKEAAQRQLQEERQAKAAAQGRAEALIMEGAALAEVKEELKRRVKCLEEQLRAALATPALAVAAAFFGNEDRAPAGSSGEGLARPVESTTLEGAITEDALEAAASVIAQLASISALQPAAPIDDSGYSAAAPVLVMHDSAARSSSSVDAARHHALCTAGSVTPLPAAAAAAAGEVAPHRSAAQSPGLQAASPAGATTAHQHTPQEAAAEQPPQGHRLSTGGRIAPAPHHHHPPSSSARPPSGRRKQDSKHIRRCIATAADDAPLGSAAQHGSGGRESSSGNGEQGLAGGAIRGSSSSSKSGLLGEDH